MGYNAMVVQPDFPTPQTIWIRTKEPRVQLALTGLDQFYSNVQYNSNQNYCYYQISYFDVPQVDDIIDILETDTLEFYVDVQIYYSLDAYDESFPAPLQQLMRSASIFLKIKLEKDMNAENFATKVRQALFKASQFGRFDVNPDIMMGYYPKNASDSNAIDQFAENAFFNHFSNFIFDPVSQNYAMIFKPPVMTRWNYLSKYMLDQQTPGLTFQPVYKVSAINASFVVEPSDNNRTSWTKRQETLICNMIGGELKYDRPVCDFRMTDNETAIYAYSALVDAVILKGATITGIDLSNNGSNVGLDIVGKSYQYKNFSDLYLYSQRVPKFLSEYYVYINSSAATNMWNPNGSTMSTVAVMPRNRAFGQQISPESAYFINQTMIKAPLHAVRSMQLTFNDADGVPLQVQGEYVLALTIHFNLALPKD